MSKRIHRSLVVGIMVIGLVAAGGLAAIASAQHPADADGEAPIEFEYFEDLGALVYWMPSDDVVDDGDEGDDPVLNCAELLAGFLEDDGTGPVDPEDFPTPEGCVVIDVTGPNGEVNHGSVVSSFTHSIKDFEYDGPRGQLVKEIAQSDFGKDDGLADDDGGEDDDEGSEDVKPEKEKKEKKEKPADHPGRGNSKP